MDKREQKRHKRHVARAKAKVRISEPDVRTPEQMKSDRETSRPAGGATGAAGGVNASASPRSRAVPASGTTKKADG